MSYLLQCPKQWSCNPREKDAALFFPLLVLANWCLTQSMRMWGGKEVSSSISWQAICLRELWAKAFFIQQLDVWLTSMKAHLICKSFVADPGGQTAGSVEPHWFPSAFLLLPFMVHHAALLRRGSLGLRSPRWAGRRASAIGSLPDHGQVASFLCHSVFHL